MDVTCTSWMGESPTETGSASVGSDAVNSPGAVVVEEHLPER